MWVDVIHFGADDQAVHRRRSLAAPVRSAEEPRATSERDAPEPALGRDPAPLVDGASMLDGYLTEIVIGPCSIPPDEWFVDLLGERGWIASAADDVLAAIKAIVARFNVISEGLSIAPKQHAPVFEKTDDGMALPHPWCMGFLHAMRLRFDEWRPLLDLNRIEHGLLLPTLLYTTDTLGRPTLGPPLEGPETEEFLRTTYQDIPLMIPAIRDFWMPQRLKQANRQT